MNNEKKDYRLLTYDDISYEKYVEDIEQYSLEELRDTNIEYEIYIYNTFLKETEYNKKALQSSIDFYKNRYLEKDRKALFFSLIENINTIFLFKKYKDKE